MSNTLDWSFNRKEIAQDFEKHVRSQLPWYGLATNMVKWIVENYIPVNGVLYDIGASTGNITSACSDIINARCVEAISIENSSEMVKIWNGVGSINQTNAQDFEYKDFDVAVLFLTAMFLTVGDREILINKLMRSKKAGGAIILIDKFCDVGGFEGTVLRRITMRQKIESGEEPKDILDKDLSLSGIQRPMLVSELPDSTKFFQAGEFSGYIL